MSNEPLTNFLPWEQPNPIDDLYAEIESLQSKLTASEERAELYKNKLMTIAYFVSNYGIQNKDQFQNIYDIAMEVFKQ